MKKGANVTMEKKKYLSVFKEGLLTNNPTFVQLLGMCPTLATTTSVANAIGMGAAVVVVLMCSNLVISLLRRLIPERIRIPAFIVIIATFVTIVDMLMKAFLPALNQTLGIYIPLIVVNCIIFARAESFAFKNPPLASMVDGLGMGLGFTGALVIVSAVREMIGLGTLFAGLPFAIKIPVYAEMPATVFALPAGGFLTLGLILGIINAIRLRKEESK